VKKAPYSR